MPQEMHLRARGLFPDPNPLGVAPDGALLEALNVRIRRDGVLEPREGFSPEAIYNGTDLDFHTVYKIVEFDAVRYVVANSGSAWQLYLTEAPWTSILDWEGAPLSFVKRYIPFVDAKQNLYFVTAAGVHRISQSTDTNADRTGMPQPHNPYARPVSAGSGGWFVPDSTIAYRVVFSRFVNDQEIMSSPSGRGVARHASGGQPEFPRVTVYLPPDVRAGDVIRFYRSEVTTPETVEPSDEMSEVTRIEISDADITAGFLVYTDTVKEDEANGAALYTNDTQEGATQGNERPPLALECAYFNRMMFYTGIGPEAVYVELPSIRQTEENVENAFGCHDGEIGGTTTAGSDTITGVLAADLDKVAIGMMLTDAATPHFDGPLLFARSMVIDKVGGTIVLDKVAAGSGVLIAKAGDWFKINSNYYHAFNADIDFTYKATWPLTSEGIEQLSTRTFINPIADTVRISVGRNDVGAALVFYKDTLSGGPFTMESSKSVFRSGKTAESSRIGGENYIWWSKSDQPEAVPITNLTTIGSERSPTLRLVPTRDSLFIFKTDGVWRLTGDTPETIRIDAFDPSLVLVHPNAAALLDNAVYAWTNKGVVRITDGGIDILSDVAMEAELSPKADAYLNDPGRIIAGPFAVANQRRGEFFLGVPSSTAVDSAEFVYSFDTKTLAWTRWAFPDDVMCALASDRMYFGGQQSNTFASVRGANEEFHDGVTSYTITDVTGDAVTVAAGAGATPQRGDLLEQGVGNVAIVTDTTGPNEFTIDVISGVITTGAADVFTSYESEVEWIAKTGGNPGIRKHWRDCTLVLSDFSRLHEARVRFRSELGGTLGPVVYELPWSTAVDSDRLLRSFVSRRHARSSLLRPELKIKAAKSNWACTGLSLVFEPMSERQP